MFLFPEIFMLNYFVSYNNLLYLGHIKACLGLTPAFPTDSTFHEWELYVNILIILNTNSENKPCGAPFPHSRCPVTISKNFISLQLCCNGPLSAIYNSWGTILEHEFGSSLSYSFSLVVPNIFWQRRVNCKVTYMFHVGYVILPHNSFKTAHYRRNIYYVLM